MKRNDRILMGVIVMVSVLGMVLLFFLQNQSGALAEVSYRDTPILRIDLRDGSHEVLEESFMFRPSLDENNPLFQRCFAETAITCVRGELGVVVIEFDQGRVRVIEETSPQNICQLQGFTDSPFQPLTCLPNYIVITVLTDDESDDDFIT